MAKKKGLREKIKGGTATKEELMKIDGSYSPKFIRWLKRRIQRGDTLLSSLDIPALKEK